MAKAIDVARYLVYLASNEDEADYLTNLRLQKLLYYVQAWSLAERNQPMFPERIEAWVHGPVVRDLYRTFDRSDRPILVEDIGEPEFDLSDEERNYVASVWEAYKGYSTSKLREMTHQEAPWINARNGCGPADGCDAEITPKAMVDYFRSVPAE